MTTELDTTDRTLIAALLAQPRASVTDIARRTGVARGTVYSRLERLERAGVITGFGPDVDARRVGYDVLAFCTLEIAQGAHGETTRALAEIPEVTEVHTVTGTGDLLCRIVARSNDHLHEILLQVTATPTVRHSHTQLSLHTDHVRSVAALVARPPASG